MLALSSSTYKEAIVEIEKAPNERRRDPTATDVLGGYRGSDFLGHLEKGVDGSGVRLTVLILLLEEVRRILP